LNEEENKMKTLEMAKVAFASRGTVDSWFKDAAPNFELFAEMVRKDEREAIIMTVIPGGYICDPQTICDRIRERSLSNGGLGCGSVALCLRHKKSTAKKCLVAWSWGANGN